MADKSELPPKAPRELKLTRRDFLKAAGAGLAGLALSPIIGGEADRTRNITNENISEKISDLLSPERLRELNIDIYNTDFVKLHLREGVFQFPIFEDLKEKKLDGLHLVLVDHGNVSWKTTESMPKLPKEFLQAFVETPGDWSEEMWLNTIENSKIELANNKAQAQYYLDMEKWYVETQTARGLSLTDEKFLAALEANRALYDLYKEMVLKSEEKTNALSGDREEAVEYLMNDDYENGAVVGYFWYGPAWYKFSEEGGLSEATTKRAKEFFKKYPELKNEALIYLAVGGDFPPTKDQSFPNPQNYSLSTCLLDYLQNSSIDCYIVDNVTPGFAFRHELSHYQSAGTDSGNPEAKTDWLAFKSFQKSWQEHQAGGNPNAYPFVFMTPGGPVFTKRNSGQSKA